MRALEERVALIEDAIVASQQQQPEARSMAHLESSPAGSQRRSSVASTEHPNGEWTEMVADNPQCYPMDDNTVRTPYELCYH